jgi:hypothetical protein
MIKKVERLRAIQPGGYIWLKMGEESYPAWKQRVFEANREDGWRHYSLTKVQVLGKFMVINNEKPEDDDNGTIAEGDCPGRESGDDPSVELDTAGGRQAETA